MGVGDDVMLAAWSGSIRRVRPAFFPPRQSHESKTNPPRLETNRVSPLPATSPVARDAASPTRRLLASRADAASKSLHCRSPSPGADTPTESPCEGRTGSRSNSVDRRRACDQGNGSAARAEAGAVRSRPTVDRRAVVQPRSSPRRCWGSTASIGTNSTSLSLILKAALRSTLPSPSILAVSARTPHLRPHRASYSVRTPRRMTPPVCSFSASGRVIAFC